MPPPENRVRDEIIGPDSGPEPPFPIRLSGPVIKGFGRGSRELGIPTANIPISGLSVGGNSDLASGVYFGWVGLDLSRARSSDEATPAHDGAVTSDSDKPPSGASTPSKPTVNPTISRAQSAAQLALSTPRSTTPTGLAAHPPPKDTYPAVLSIGYNPFYNNTHRSVEIHVMHTFARDFYNARLKLSILGFIRPEYDYESLEKLVEDIKTDIEVAGRSLAREMWGVERGEKWLVDFEEVEEVEERK